MFDVVALGELLIDFVLKSITENGEKTFAANPGGAPCNVLCQLAKLGKSTAFIGKVGNDMFGNDLKRTLEGYSINTDNLALSDTEFTTLAFVTLDKDGNRSFSFSRKNSADVMLCSNEVDESVIKSAKIFHCGTLSLTSEPSESATLKALKTAEENGVTISVDPNLRLPLWENAEQAREAMKTVFSFAEILKISDNEVEFFKETDDIKAGAREIFNEYKPAVMFVTCGKNGAFALTESCEVFDSGFPEVKTVDTTGAGDSFCGAAISEILDLHKPLEAITKDELEKILKFANSAASLSTTAYGAMPSMKTRKEIETLVLMRQKECEKL